MVSVRVPVTCVDFFDIRGTYSKNYYDNVRIGTKGRVERSRWRERANRDTNRNLGGNNKLEPLLGNYYIFTELIEDVIGEVYKVQFRPRRNARHAPDMILKWRCNSDIVSVLPGRLFHFVSGQLSLGAHFSPGPNFRIRTWTSAETLPRYNDELNSQKVTQ